MKRFTVSCASAVSVVVITLAVVGCSQHEAEEPQPPLKPASHAPRVISTPPSMSAEISPSESGKMAGLPAVEGDSMLAAKEAAALETNYLAQTEFADKVETLYKISDLGTSDALGVLTRLFLQEKDEDAKTQIIDAMGDIEGFTEKKLALLTMAVKADQPQDVRTSAIDALTDIEDARVMPILQSLLDDPDEDIRSEAEDGIKLMQDTLNKAGTP